MADILTQLADYYAGRKPAQAKVIPTAEGKVLDASQEQPTVFKGMMLPGADIVLEAPKPKAPEPEPIQDLAPTVVEAEPYSRAEPSSQVLARTKFDFGNIFDQLKAMEPKQTATESIESVKTRMQQPKAKVDLNAVMSDLNEAKTAQPDWSQEDYIKGALFTILPALVGNAMYGVSGAYAGAAGGQKGFESYMTQRQKEAEEKAKSAKSKAELRLKAYEAEQKYDLQDLDRALKLADLELRRDGKVSDVTNNRLNTLVNAVRGIETDVFKTDQAREGARDLQIMRDASAEDRARLGLEVGTEKAKTLAELKAEAAAADRAFKAEQNRLDRENALAKQKLANQGKAAGGKSTNGVTQVTGKKFLDQMTIPDQIFVKKNTEQAATMQPLIENLAQSYRDVSNKNLETELRIQAGRNALKLINSLQTASPDAVGAEEAKRLGAFFEYNIFNPLAQGPLMGMSLDSATKDMLNILLRARKSQEQLRIGVNEIYKRYGGTATPGQTDYWYKPGGLKKASDSAQEDTVRRQKERGVYKEGR